ncbi:MAG: hypothetical protein K2F70_04800 [Muribaculaceae bacterium]|nr:hypothetical protein [Muribaculaceae bacterium]
MEQPYRANTLIVKSVGMLPGASAEYTSLSMNVQHLKIQAAVQNFDTALFWYIPLFFVTSYIQTTKKWKTYPKTP